MRVQRPTTLEEALTLLATAGESLTPIAGGTDLMVSWHHRDKKNLALLDLSRLRPELHRINLGQDYLELGGLTTYWDLLTHKETCREFPLLADAARQVGAIPIQTRGTWAGNIANASPAADGVLALLAYDARVVLKSLSDEVEIPLDTYYTGYKLTVRQPDQMITAIKLPRRPREHQWFYKVGARQAQAISKVGVATAKDATGWHIAANSVAPYVCRCRHLEEELSNRPQNHRFTNPDEIREILNQDVTPIDDLRSTAKYRLTVLTRLIYFWLNEQNLCD